MANDNPYASPVSPGQMPTSMDPHGQKLASRWERFVGAFVDSFVVGLINFLIALYVLAPVFDVARGGINIPYLISGAITFIAIFFAVNGYFLATSGQTLGKLFVGTQIVSETDGKILPFRSIALRRYLPFFLAYNIPMVGGFLSLINSVMIFRENHKCFHDDVANTKVIKL